MKDYWDIASRAFPSVNEHADAPSAGLLNSLRLSQDVKGFFKPLTATSKTADDTKDVLNPMVGCQVTLEGIGVQWASAQVLAVTAALVSACFVVWLPVCLCMVSSQCTRVVMHDISSQTRQCTPKQTMCQENTAAVTASTAVSV